MAWCEPGSGPPGQRSTWRERWLALKDVWAVAALFLFVMGGIYGGFFTATEGAGIGAAGALVFALARRAITGRTLFAAVLESARTRALLSTCRERWLALKDVCAVAALFLFVMGGIYGGFFTATEGAGIGAAGALVFALARRAITGRTLYAALLESARTTAMLFLILIGALMFAEFINITTMPADLKAWVTRFQVSPVMVVAAICAIYVVLGTAMEEL